MAYNGYPTWNSWNVSMWLSSTWRAYRLAQDILDMDDRTPYAKMSADRATALFMLAYGIRPEKIGRNYHYKSTPDGARLTIKDVRHWMAALIAERREYNRRCK